MRKIFQHVAEFFMAVALVLLWQNFAPTTAAAAEGILLLNCDEERAEYLSCIAGGHVGELTVEGDNLILRDDGAQLVFSGAVNAPYYFAGVKNPLESWRQHVLPMASLAAEADSVVAIYVITDQKSRDSVIQFTANNLFAKVDIPAYGAEAPRKAWFEFRE